MAEVRATFIFDLRTTRPGLLARAPCTVSKGFIALSGGFPRTQVDVRSNCIIEARSLLRRILVTPGQIRFSWIGFNAIKIESGSERSKAVCTRGVLNRGSNLIAAGLPS